MAFSVISRSKLWLTLSALLIAGAFVAIFTLGLNWGIDFTGGSLLEVGIPNSSVEAVKGTMLPHEIEASVQEAGENEYLLRTRPLSEEEHQDVLAALSVAHGDVVEVRFDAVGPSIGEELRHDAVGAVALLLIAIGCYIAWAFRKVSDPVKSWQYGVVTAFAALHDVIIPLGIFAILGRFLGFEIDTAFVAAMLTILGYSINDTIVVMDRIRENLVRHRHAQHSFAYIVDQSVRETLGRSLNTTFTTLLPLVAIAIFGGDTTRPFVIALILGIIAGAYSSIFIASPLLVEWEKWGRNKRK